jgi:hypothetical protein
MGLLQELDNARRVAGRNLQDLFSDPSAYAERLTDRLRNMNAGVTPIATPMELTKRPQTLEERVEDWSGRLDPGSGMMGVIKPRGGNWLTGRYGPDDFISRLKKPNADALNAWIDNQLTKYIKNDMAAPTDPIRKLADAWPEEQAQKLALAEARIAKLRQKQQAQAATRGVPEEYLTQTRQDILAAEEARDLIAENTGLHIPVRGAHTRTTSYLMDKRAAEGFPVYGMATTPMGRQWETQVDSELSPQPVKDFLLSENLKQDPWLAKADPNARVNTIMYGSGEFKHLTDELYNSLREGRITPEQLTKMPIDQAVRHVAEINALRKVNAAKQQAMDASEIPLYKDYPEQGLSWRHLRMPEITPELAQKLEQNFPEDVAQFGHPVAAQKQLQKWLTQEGDAMGHCVGGYCDDVSQGYSNIYSLRDAKGKPYVTIETQPNLIDMDEFSGGWIKGRMNQADAIQAIRELARSSEFAKGKPGWQSERGLEHWVESILANKEGIPVINQVKGPGNQAPDPKFYPQIQDFIKQGKWGEIRDLHHTGLDPLQIDQYLVE